MKLRIDLRNKPLNFARLGHLSREAKAEDGGHWYEYEPKALH